MKAFISRSRRTCVIERSIHALPLSRLAAQPLSRVASLQHPLSPSRAAGDVLPIHAPRHLAATRRQVKAAFLMLLSLETEDDGSQRVYFTRANSVISYFADDGEGGVSAHVAPGEFACPYGTTDHKLSAVKMCMLEETARRLACRIDQVQLHSLDDLKRVCDPHLKHSYHWAGRSKTRPRGVR
jgi:hypothetical protein